MSSSGAETDELQRSSKQVPVGSDSPTVFRVSFTYVPKLRRTEVIEHWEASVGHRLSGSRRTEFYKRPEVDSIGALERQIASAAATEAMRENPRGELLLTEWLQRDEALAVESQRTRADAKAQADAERAHAAALRTEAKTSLRSKGPHIEISYWSCSSCGAPITVEEGCRCS